jgi:hypothetical protein
MQKVVGSSPISRLPERPLHELLFPVVRSLVRLILGRILDSEWTVIRRPASPRFRKPPGSRHFPRVSNRRLSASGQTFARHDRPGRRKGSCATAARFAWEASARLNARDTSCRPKRTRHPKTRSFLICAPRRLSRCSQCGGKRAPRPIARPRDTHTRARREHFGGRSVAAVAQWWPRRTSPSGSRVSAVGLRSAQGGLSTPIHSPAHTVRSATVGGIRDARTAGIRPANAPIRMAEAMPPAQASTGMTMAQCFVLA